MKESADRPLQGSSAYGKMPLIRAKSIPFRFRLMAKTPLHFFAHPLPTATAALGCGGVPQKEVVAIMFMILGIGLFLLPILFRLVLKLRLGAPMLCALLMLTAFQGWYLAHTALTDGIFFALAGLAALSWVVTLLRRLWGLLEDWREERPWLTASGRPGPPASTISTPRASGDRYPSPISSRISLSLILMQPTSILKITSPT